LCPHFSSFDYYANIMVKLDALFIMAAMPVAAILRGTSQNMDLNLALHGMHPEQVSMLLNQVESRWEAQRASSLRNQTDEKDGLQAMIKSCSKVAMAIVTGSEGDKEKVAEYMQDVCASNKDQNQINKCQQFSSGIERVMSDDARFNRDELDLSNFCQAFWTGPVTDAAKVLAQQAEEENAEKAQQEAEAEEKKTQEALAAKQAEQTQAANEAVNKTAEAVQHAAEVEEQVKGIQASMATDEENATKLLDLARQEDQVANEKEAKEAEAKAAIKSVADARSAESDEAKALEEGDAKADAIAAKALANTNETQEQNVTISNTAAAKDDAQAVAAGDEIAEKIADKALKKAANVSAEAKNATHL
jgi:hypothetical protein